MKNKSDNINMILAKWDPIGVGEDMATDEYKSYVSLILKSCETKYTLMKCLEDILINKIGIDYDSSNKTHVGELNVICDEIMKIVN